MGQVAPVRLECSSRQRHTPLAITPVTRGMGTRGGAGPAGTGGLWIGDDDELDVTRDLRARVDTYKTPSQLWASYRGGRSMHA